MDNLLVMYVVQCSSKTAPEVIRHMQWDQMPFFLIQLQRVFYAQLCYNDEMTIVWITSFWNRSHSIHLQCCPNEGVACKTTTIYTNEVVI